MIYQEYHSHLQASACCHTSLILVACKYTWQGYLIAHVAGYKNEGQFRPLIPLLNLSKKV